MHTKNILITVIIVLLFVSLTVVLAQKPFFDGAPDPESQAVMRQAAIDIEKYRKGNFILHIVDIDGNPIKDAVVEAELSSHIFDFGTNLFGISALNDDNPLKEVAKQTIIDIFNTVAVVNYWHHPQNEQHVEKIQTDIAWAQANNLRTRFHAVFFNDPRHIFFGNDFSEEQCWEKIEERIKYVADATSGELPEYDVINEMVSKIEWDRDRPNAFMKNVPNFPDFTDPQVVKRVFDMTRKYLPNTKLVGLEAQVPSINNPVYMEIIEYWKRCLAIGADIDLIGTQAHFYTGGMEYQEGHWRFGPETFHMKKVNLALEALRSIERPIVITEFNGPSRNSTDNPVNREKFWTMSDYENSAWQINFYRLAFSKPYIEGLTRWFHIDNLGGRGMDAGILYESGEKHQIYYDLRKLIKEEWHTNVVLTTTQDGKANFRGFLGYYTISTDGYKPETLRLDNDSMEIVIKLIKI